MPEPNSQYVPTEADLARLNHQVEGILGEAFSLGDQANAMVAYALRNGPIENIHADNTDLIPEDAPCSKITDREMQVVMVYACEHLTALLEMQQARPLAFACFIRAYWLNYCQTWAR